MYMVICTSISILSSTGSVTLSGLKTEHMLTCCEEILVICQEFRREYLCPSALDFPDKNQISSIVNLNCVYWVY
jgi:hypothetical protein